MHFYTVFTHGTRTFSSCSSAPTRRALQRLLGVLLRPTCVSISVSNHYLSLAEPAGAILLRNGRVPERTLLKLLKPYCGELTGVVIGSEAHTHWRDLVAAPPAAADSLRQVHAVLPVRLARHTFRLVGPLDSRHTSVVPPACSDHIRGGSGRATNVGGGRKPYSYNTVRLNCLRRRPASSAAGAQCSMGTLFLQHYLDNLGALNTFG